MLLEALAACTGVTLRAVATSLELPVRGETVHADAHTLIVLIWHVRHDTTEARTRRLIRDLHTLGYHVTIHPRRLTQPTG